MRDCFETLPPEGQVRFMTAPETVHSIRRLRAAPLESVRKLCHFLNAESLVNSRGRVTVQHWTALGDKCYAGTCGGVGVPWTDGQERQPGESFQAPVVAGIPVDFFSPNVFSAKTTTGASSETEYLEFTPEERASVCSRLEDAITCVRAVSESAARVVMDFVKVIIPIKIRAGYGSTSKRSFPGRVILRGIERASAAIVAEALIHEAIHQLMYVLEYEGPFVIEDLSERVRSAWTGRPLLIDAFFHACFVWYGLAQFWALAGASGAFSSDEVRSALDRCGAGFQGPNPAEVLAPHAGTVRIDALNIALTLQQHLGVVRNVD